MRHALLAISLLAAASAGATNLWTGTASFANYKLASGERPVVKAEAFANANVGDKIVFAITNNAEDPTTWHQVELYDYDAEIEPVNALCLGVHVLPEMTEATFTIDETLLGKLRDTGFCAAGTGYFVTSIDLVVNDGTVWKGTSTCTSWAATPPVTLTGSAFAAAKAGDQLVLTASVIKVGDWAAIQIDRSNYVASAVYGTHELAQVEGDQELVIDITEEVKTELQTYGINITGANFVLTKIAIRDAADVKPVDPNLIWEGSMRTDDWTNSIIIPAEKFAAVKTNDTLLFTVTDAGADGSIALKSNLPTGWGELPSAEEFGNYLHLTEGSCTVSFTVNAEAAESLKAYGLVVAGSYYTLTQVSYGEPAEEGAIQAISADPKSSAVYDLNGRRVSNIPRPGIYLSAGKKFIVK